MTAGWILAAALWGGILYRWRGMAHPWKKYFPRPFNQIAFAFPYALTALPVYWSGRWRLVESDTIITKNLVWVADKLPEMGLSMNQAIATIVILCFLAALVVWILTTLAVLTGHGRWMDLATSKKSGDDERLEFLIKWLYGRIPEYWYDALGLAVVGMAITLPAGIMLMNPWIAVSGALKAPAYMIGHKTRWGTEAGEALTGAFLWGTLACLV